MTTQTIVNHTCDRCGATDSRSLDAGSVANPPLPMRWGRAQIDGRHLHLCGDCLTALRHFLTEGDGPFNADL